MTAASDVVRAANVSMDGIGALLARFGLYLRQVADGEPVPGSYWGESEAGLAGHELFWRTDTPVHSILHEASHYICMDDPRRAGLDCDAGGDHGEENAVCYLQVLLADAIAGFGRERMWLDMDRWGYTFRLGSAKAWFLEDAEDARQWLEREGIVTSNTVTGRIRCCRESRIGVRD